MEPVEIFIGVGLLVAEGIIVYLAVLARIDKRFGSYVLKGEQRIVNEQLNRDIADIKRSIEKISNKIEKMVEDVPGIIVRAMREERR